MKEDDDDDESDYLLEKKDTKDDVMPASFFRPSTDYPGHHVKSGPDPEKHNIMIHTYSSH